MVCVEEIILQKLFNYNARVVRITIRYDMICVLSITITGGRHHSDTHHSDTHHSDSHHSDKCDNCRPIVCILRVGMVSVGKVRQ